MTRRLCRCTEKPRTLHDPGLRKILLPLDADGEIQVDVRVGCKAVLEVARKTRIGGCVYALRDRSAEESLGAGGLKHVQRRPTTVGGSEAFKVGAEGAPVVVADRGAHGERDEGSRQRCPFTRQPVVGARLEQGPCGR